MPPRILILCTGNAARSQMAEGLMKSFDSRLDVQSAGTKPAARVHPAAVEAMREIGIDISGGYPKSVNQFLAEPFDFVITVCDDANETCPVFAGDVRQRVHIGFEDPAKAVGSRDDILNAFRKARDQIRTSLFDFYVNSVKPASSDRTTSSPKPAGR
jgi:arsenate reductase